MIAIPEGDPDPDRLVKRFRIEAGDMQPLHVLKADGIPKLWEEWEPYDPALPVENTQRKCVCINLCRVDAIFWSVTAEYADCT